MNIVNKDQAIHLLRWYTDCGITAAVGTPLPIISSNIDKFSPTQMIIPQKVDKKSNTDLGHITSLQSLKDALHAIDTCDLRKTATNLVFGEGPTESPLVMVIGEAPGADEDAQGRPFVGLSGQLLDKILLSIGLNRKSNCYISNIVPWRPPLNRQPNPQEIDMYMPYIERHIELINPHLLLLVGGVPAKSILRSKEGIMKLRGQWFNYITPFDKKTIPTLATYHPAFLLRSPGQKAQVWKDLLIFKEKLDSLF